MIFSGVDEAGLGPILGPFCGTAVSLSSPGDPMDLLKDVNGKLFTVDDSKKVYKGKYGLKRLELNVLGFYYILGSSLPESVQDFIPSLGTKWYQNRMQLPVANTREEIINHSRVIDEELKRRGISIVDIKRTSVTEKDFNLLIDRYDNKSLVIQKIITPLLLSVIKQEDTLDIVVDKQGGRKFYLDFLDEITNESGSIVYEENNSSKYRYSFGTVEFKAKADSSSFPVALASMFSKYMREISMALFNQYWNSLTTIKHTAGYYVDGMRFIKELEEKGILPDRDTLIRKK